MSAELKLDKFLLIRAICCIIVFFTHIPIVQYIDKDYPLSKNLVFNGSASVSIFFVLSGYLITKQFLSEKYSLDFDGIKTFWFSRVKRILPITYLSILFCILLNPNILNTQGGGRKILQTVFFYFDVDSQPQFMNQLWSLSLEMQFYFLIPFILLKLNKHLKKVWILTLIGILTLIASLFYRRFAINFLEQYSTLNQFRHFGLHFPFLFFGVLTSYFEYYLCNFNFHKKKILSSCKVFVTKNSNSLFYVLLVLNFVLIWIIKVVYGAKSFDVIWFAWLQMIIVAILILVANVNNLQVKNLYFNFGRKYNLRQKIINFVNNFGILSFPFYLVHSEIIYAIIRITNSPWAIIISFIISYFCAIIIYKLSSVLKKTIL
jgi:peptidoglycan/LPS O-acetylase OafA/YrhL